MKKLLLILSLVSVASFANAQFLLTPTGFVDKANPDKDYVVLNVDGKTKAELYKNTLVYLNSIYSNPKEAISTVDGESITVSAIDESALAAVYNKYTFSFEFKDGKIKVNRPAYALYFTPNGVMKEYDVYNNKGKLRREKDKENLETFYNGYVTLIKTNAEKKNDNW